MTASNSPPGAASRPYPSGRVATAEVKAAGPAGTLEAPDVRALEAFDCSLKVGTHA